MTKDRFLNHDYVSIGEIQVENLNNKKSIPLTIQSIRLGKSKRDKLSMVILSYYITLISIFYTWKVQLQDMLKIDAQMTSSIISPSPQLLLSV